MEIFWKYKLHTVEEVQFFQWIKRETVSEFIARKEADPNLSLIQVFISPITSNS